MTFSVNDSPFAGREGKFVTLPPAAGAPLPGDSEGRLLRVTETENTDSFNVAGRGEMSLSILIETMRREGAMSSRCSSPACSTRRSTARSAEPIERLVVDVPADSVGRYGEDRLPARVRS